MGEDAELMLSYCRGDVSSLAALVNRHSAWMQALLRGLLPTAADADALASAVSVLGPEKGLALIRALPQTEAQILHLTEEGKVEKFGKE